MALSLLLHTSCLVVVDMLLRAPELELEFELPMDVEFGTAEELAAAPPVQALPEQSAADPAGTRGGASDAGVATDAAIVDGGADAGVRDAAVRTPRVRDAGAPSLAAAKDGGTGPGRLPAGTQIAVRVDMERIRRSPIADDVRSVLAAIPDWKALLEGSGIDPVEQLERLLIATPNLQREKLVLAGRYLGGEQVVRAAVAQLAEARGQRASWRIEGGVQVAPWANADVTPRVLALLGPAHFAIARAEDLPRVLAIAGARVKRRGQAAPPAEHPADALLSMGPDEGLSLEVEGVAQFVRRGRRGVPERLRLAAIERAGTRVELRGELNYPDEASATDAAAYVEELRERYASNALIALLGLSGALDEAKIERLEQTVHVTVVLTTEQTRLVLGYVRELFTPPAGTRRP